MTNDAYDTIVAGHAGFTGASPVGAYRTARAEFGRIAYGPTRGFSSLTKASSLLEATVEHCRCGDLTLALPGVPCGRCGELP